MDKFSSRIDTRKPILESAADILNEVYGNYYTVAECVIRLGSYPAEMETGYTIIGTDKKGDKYQVLTPYQRKVLMGGLMTRDELIELESWRLK